MEDPSIRLSLSVEHAFNRGPVYRLLHVHNILRTYTISVIIVTLTVISTVMTTLHE